MNDVMLVFLSGATVVFIYGLIRVSQGELDDVTENFWLQIILVAGVALMWPIAVGAHIVAKLVEVDEL